MPRCTNLRNMSRLKVLLTGPGGRVGPHLLPSFNERYDLRLLDIKPIEGFPNTVITDLTDPEALNRAVEGIDVIVHLAAQADEAPFHEKLLQPNIVGVYNLFEAAHKAGVRRIVFASTVQAVGAASRGTIQANDVPHPSSVYGATKVWGEALGSYFHDRHGMEFVVVRLGGFQPYDSPVIRESRNWKDIWLSPRDCIEVFQRCVEGLNLKHEIIFATSITVFERMSRTPMKELLDYEPVDNVKDYIPPAPPA